jgi:CBS domain containing-hemolysin-like protein
VFLLLLILVGLLVLFGALSAALTDYSRAQVADLFEKRRDPDSLERFVLLQPQYLMAALIVRVACLLGVFVVVLYEFNVLSLKGPPALIVLSSLVGVVIVFLFGSCVPHVWAKYAGARLVVRLQPVLAGLRIAFYPLVMVLHGADSIVRRLAGLPDPTPKSTADEFEQEILSTVSEGRMRGAVDEEEKEMIESVIELGDTRVQEIMTPRTEIVALPVDVDLPTVLDTIRAKGHSRIPVYRETIDGIVGVLYAKDLLHHMNDKPFDVTRIMRKPLYVPESKGVRDLLREFREKKVHLAVVLDEYGGTAGLASIEDILEELVGEIADEYDKSGPIELKRIDADTVEVDARMRIDELNEALRLQLPEDGDYETIGGLVFGALGKVPRVGERCEYGDVGIQVVSAEPQRITRVRIRVRQPAESEKAEV